LSGPLPLETVVQHYSWGSRTLIPALLGLPAPAPDPWAELWVGAHRGGPSRLPDGRTLADVEPDLPYLLKLLSAVEPLSLQAHPDEEQAVVGYAREEAAGIPFEAPERTYKDAHAKPEMLVALTPFSALCGFRDPVDALRLTRALDCPALDPLAQALDQTDPEAALRDAFTLGMTVPADRRTQLVVAAAAASAGRAADPGTDVADGLAYAWLARLALLHLGDLSALAPLLLQTVRLEPGEALALPPRTLHAYLAGGAIEIMGSSDNVLRGGLTPKHVDIDALLGVVDFHASTVPWVRPRPVSPGVATYDSGVEAFRLLRVEASGGGVAVPAAGPRLVLVTSGELDVRTAGGAVLVRPGRAAYVPADAGPLEVAGTGVAWVAEPGARAGA
jgi:mannose-6-phosphate isomerase